MQDLDGVPALMLELGEGPTPGQWLGEDAAIKPPHAGVFSDEAMALPRQIADALELAHARTLWR